MLVMPFFNSATPKNKSCALLVYYSLLCASLSSTGERLVIQHHGGHIVEEGISCYAGEQSVAFIESITPTDRKSRNAYNQQQLSQNSMIA
jgi:hypothetical protein